MPDLNQYWAEEALGEPYAPQNYTWLKSRRRMGLVMGGATCALTAGALLSAAVFYLVDRSPRVAISSYEIEAAAPTIVIVQGQIAPTGAVGAGKAPAKPSRDIEASTVRTDIPSKAVHSPGSASAGKPASAHDKAPIAVPPEKPAPEAAVSPAKAKAAPPAPTADKNIPAKAPETPPAAKQEPETRVGISKGAENKPADIASGEKLGIREILADGIVMQNGRKVKNGSALPNGEILMGTDPGKWMAETDRRILVLTP